MANANNFTIVITALDRTSATMMRINASMAGLSSPILNIGRSMAKLSEVSGLENLGRAAENVGAKFANLGSKISGVLGPLAALGAAASAAGLYEMAKGATDWGHNLSISAEKTGVAADMLAKLHYAASTVNVGADQLDSGLIRMNRTIADVAGGRNKVAAEYLRKMGISVYDANHHLKDAGQLFPEVSKAMAANGSIAEKTGAAMALMGRSGAQLIPVFDLGGKKLDGLMKTFEQMYGKITPAVIKAADEGHESFERLSLAGEGLKFTIGSALFPAMEKIITPITAWVAANRKLIAMRVGEWAKKIGDALAQVDWKSVVRAVVDFGSAVYRVVNFLGPFWSTVALGAVVFSPFIAAALSAGTALVELGIAASGVAVRFGALAFGGLIADIATAIPMIGSFADAFAALDVVLDANPIGAIVLGIAALGAAAFAVYEYWGPISAFFERIWVKTKAIFVWAYNNILPWIPGGMMVKGIFDNWKPITAFFSNLWKNVTAIFERAWSILKPIIDTVVGGAKWLLEHTGLLGAANAIGNAASNVVHYVFQGAENIELHGAALESHRAAIANFAHNAATMNMPSGPGPVGMRLNNPLNMRSWGNSPLVNTKSGNFAQFASPELGVSAAAGQLQLYNRRGLNTISSIISKWAPSSENNTGSYISAVSKQMGMAPGAQLNLNDSGTMQRLIAAMARHEQGGDKFSPSVIAAGVNLRFGAPQPRMASIARNVPPPRVIVPNPVAGGMVPNLPAGNPNVSSLLTGPVVSSSHPVIDRRYAGSRATAAGDRSGLDVRVQFDNIPAGTRTTVNKSGDAIDSLEVGKRFANI